MDFNDTISREEHKTILSDLRISEVAISNQSDIPAFFELVAPQKANLLNLLKGFDDTSSLSHHPGTSDTVLSQAGIDRNFL